MSETSIAVFGKQIFQGFRQAALVLNARFPEQEVETSLTLGPAPLFL